MSTSYKAIKLNAIKIIHIPCAMAYYLPFWDHFKKTKKLQPIEKKWLQMSEGLWNEQF